MRRLARAVTLKNAMAGLAPWRRYVADPTEEKERLIRAFACALKDETGYKFGPDTAMSTRRRAGGDEVTKRDAQKDGPMFRHRSFSDMMCWKKVVRIKSAEQKYDGRARP